MSKEKFTPGPWREGFNDGSGKCDADNGAWIIGDGEKLVVHGGRDDWGAAIGVVGHTEDVAKANAALITAAPEMYEAMKEFCERVERKEIGSIRTYKKFKAILAKADGTTKPEKQTACPPSAK